MKLVTYTFRGTTRLGALLHRDGGEGGFDDGTVVDLNRACALHRADHRADHRDDHRDDLGERRARALADFLVPSDMRAFLEAGDPAMDAARAALAHAAERIAKHRDDAMAAGLAFGTDERGFRLEAPVSRPGKVLAVGVNYRDHSAETGIPVPERPLIFAKNATCIVGPGTPIEKPRFSPFLDWEGELCFVVGRRARHVPADRALEYVAGYMVGHDVSVRDWQVHSQTMMMGKSFDTHGPTGPWLVTRDEVPDPGTLGLKTLVNGVVKQDSDTDRLIFGVPALVAYLSQAFTLEPGDVVFTGTPAGVGVARKPKEFLKAGDVVRIEITGLGALENPVVDEPER